MARSRLRAALASLLALGTLLAITLPQTVDAQPKPLPADRSGSSKDKNKGEGDDGVRKGSSVKRPPHEECPQCYKDMGTAVVKCKEDFDRCTKPCAACRAPGDCHAREKCSTPCAKALEKCMATATKELESCMRGC